MTKTSNPSLDEIRQRLEPGTIRANLVRASLYLAGWEMLKAEVQERVKSFFVIGFDASEFSYSDEYQKHVLSRHKSLFEASLLWLVGSAALTEAEADRVRALRAYRNKIAHELPKILVEVGHDVEVERILDMKALLARLGVFWGRIEVDINPDFDGEDVENAGIKTGAMLLMDHLLAVAEETRTG